MIQTQKGDKAKQKSLSVEHFLPDAVIEMQDWCEAANEKASVIQDCTLRVACTSCTFCFLYMYFLILSLISQTYNSMFTLQKQNNAVYVCIHGRSELLTNELQI